MSLGREPNVDRSETERFEAQASTWWDPDGPMRPLHELNPARVQYILDRLDVDGSELLDVGCGGGILAESMAAAGARVTGIDPASRVLDVARLHLHESGLKVKYEVATVESLASRASASFDVITCMEMLEHVPEPNAVVEAISRLLRPGGHAFFSTLNRTPLAFAVGIVGAEYVARLCPRGTHRYDRFIRPSELGAWMRAAGMSVTDISGIHYNPIARSVMVGGHVQVNYLMHAVKPGDKGQA